MAPTSLVLSAALGQHSVVLLLTSISKDNEKLFLPHYCVITATSVPDSLWGSCQLCHGFCSGEFTFSVMSLPLIFWKFMFVKLFAFCLQVQMGIPILPHGAQSLGFLLLQSFSVYTWQEYVSLGAVPWPMPGLHWVAASSTAFSRGDFHATHPAVLQPLNQYCVAYSFGELGRESPNPSGFSTWWARVFSFRFCSIWYMITCKSVVGIIPDESGVVLGIRLMNLLVPGQWSILMLDHTFTRGSQARCEQ